MRINYNEGNGEKITIQVIAPMALRRLALRIVLEESLLYDPDRFFQ